MKPTGKKPSITPPSAVRRSAARTAPGATPPRGAAGCPIVGVGASAGGLEAFTQLLRHLPADTGFAFVLVQHLDPQHDSALTQLLTGATAMPVHEVTNNLRVEANHVYVIPPNTTLGIARGVLQLRPRSRERVALRAIDFFFEALAKDQRERAVGIILSGTATDGTLGLEAIKAEGGLTLAQDDSAKYDSMPRSAVAAGCVDCVRSPQGIAKELARMARHPYLAATSAPAPAKAVAPPVPTGGRTAEAKPEDGGYQRILLLLRNHTGADFSLYKSTTIHRRIMRRAVLNRQATLDHYADFLQGNPKELNALYADTLINVTSFFRNADAFAVLQAKVFSPLLQVRSDEPLRIWVLGCSTGQEAYSIAMAFTEAADLVARARGLQIFATDLNEANLEKARHGFYPKPLVQDVSPDRLRRFFKEEDGGYRIVKPLREAVVFARQNIISDPPFSRMDLICCRNVMIYFEPSLQKKVLPTFHYALKPEGFLFLGASESIGSFAALFEPVDKRQKIFSKKPAPTRTFQLPLRRERDLPPPPGPAPRTLAGSGGRPAAPSEMLHGGLSAEREADRVTVNQYAPPGVLINAEFQIIQFRGPTGAFLESPSGKASFDLLKMAREGLLLPLRAALKRAKRENQTARQENIPIVQDGRTRVVTVEIVPLKNLPERCYLVLFTEAGQDAASVARPFASNPTTSATRIPHSAETKGESARAARLEQELVETRDYLQSVQETQEAAYEELQASNEEGQSANEELQSLNEELETSKEELESTNDELTTVNEEIASRNAELNRLNNDLTNLETSTKAVVLLLDRDLAVRRFSAQAEKQFHLTAADLGRSIGSIGHNLALPRIDNIVAAVIATSQEYESEVRDREDHWHSLRVRPYVTDESTVAGAVLVLVDIDALKRTEQLIHEEHEHATAIIRGIHDPLVILTTELRVKSANDAFYRAFQVGPEKTEGRQLFELGHRSWDIPRLRQLLEEIPLRRREFEDFEVTHAFEHIGLRTLLFNARLLNEPGDKPKEILLGIRDVTEHNALDEALAAARESLTRHAGELENIVAPRTGQLTATHRRLEASLDAVIRGKDEIRALLHESQAMQKKLRDLTRQIITTQEDERKQISRELHDEVVQTLVGINVELSALAKRVPPELPTLSEKIAYAQQLVEGSVEAVHRFARGLRPAVLDDLGLIPALHAYCKSVTEQKKLKIRLTAFAGVEALGAAERTMLYRVAQEALTNVLRHARATEVALTIRELVGAVRMEVSDNGRSFAVQKTLAKENNKRLGLVGMRERIEMVGGTLHIESMPGLGTTVRVEVPYRSRAPIKPSG